MKNSLDVPINLLNTLFEEIEITGKNYMSVNDLYPEKDIVEIVTQLS